MGRSQWILNFALVLFTLIFLFTSNCQCYELTEAELDQIFGNWRPAEYSIFQPRLNSRTKRAVGNSPSLFEFNALGQNFKFRLHPADELFSSQFVLLSRHGSETNILNSDVVESCAFQGRDERNPLKTIALVTCGNLRGVVKSPFEEFVIEPLPEAMRRRRYRRRYKRRISDLLNDHIFYRRKQLDGCSVNEDHSSRMVPEHFDRDYLHSRYSVSINHYPSSGKDRYGNKDHSNDDIKRSGETFYIETAVFVDQDLMRHMRTNFPTNTEQEVIQVVLAMVNAVQLLYNDPSLGHKVKYVLKRLELLYEDPRGLTRPHDIDDFLTKFCSWQHLENPLTDADPFHWDHALILTGLDLYTTIKEGKVNAQVVGLAPVAGMCTRTSSCTVNEGRHFESVYVVAHEIGHNLGMRHDGIQSGNNCDPSGYLMSPTLGSGKVTWSHCSKRYLTKFLATSQAKCLRDKPQIPMKHLNHESRLLPGERFSADQQCLLKYGVDSRSSSNQKQDEICRDLHCIRDHYTWTSHPALEGTQCANYRWCRRGSCVLKPRDQEYFSDKRRPTIYENHADNFEPVSPTRGEWGRWSECRSPCLYGMDGILSSGSTGLSTSKRQCHSCENEQRYLSCSAVRECSIRRKRTLQDFADEMCQRLSSDDTSLSRYADRLPLSGIRSCRIECISTGGTSVLSRNFFPDGTVCKTAATNNPTYCISGFCTEFRCEPNTLYGAGPNICRSASRPLPSSDHLRPQRIPLDVPTEAVGSIPSVLSEPTWSPWLLASSCRFSCVTPSRGIQLVSRTCLDPLGCQGLNRNIQLCIPEQSECSSVDSPFTYASNVCERYSNSVKQLSGIGMQLSSIAEDPDRGCTVACQDSSLKYRFYKVNGKDGWFPFGTECSSSGNIYKAFCLNGKCVEFNDDGTPLRRNNDLSTSHDKSRSLKFFAYDTLMPSLSTIFDINVQRSHWRSKRHSGIVIGPHSLKRTEREVKTTSHRLPGSFGDSFILSLIDEINATFSANETNYSNSVSHIDLDNPVYENERDNSPPLIKGTRVIEPSTYLEFKSAPLHKKSTGRSTNIIGWKLKTGPCSVTCGEGVVQEIWTCVDGNGNVLSTVQCLHLSRPTDLHRSCFTSQKCSKNSTLQKNYPESSFGRWLIGLVQEIKRNY